MSAKVPDHDPADVYIPGPAHRPVAANPHEWTERIKRQLAEVKRRRIDDEAEARVEAGMREPVPGDGSRIPAGDVAATTGEVSR